MAYLKPIRFNMQFDNGGKAPDQIRSLDDLKNKMNINDLYEYYSMGTLERWLEVHGETDKAALIRKLDKLDPVHVLNRIFEILGFRDEDNQIDNAIKDYLLHRMILEKKQKTESVCKTLKIKVKQEINAYEELKKRIIENKDDFSQVKCDVKGLLKNYSALFELDYINFFETMSKECPLAVFAALMNDLGREYYWVKSDRYSDPKSLSPIEDAFYKRLKTLFEITSATPNFEKGNWSVTMKSFKTDIPCPSALWSAISIASIKYGADHFQDYEKGKHVLILYCGKDVSIRPINGDAESQRYGKDVDQFEIMNGFEYCTHGKLADKVEAVNRCIVYMRID